MEKLANLRCSELQHPDINREYTDVSQPIEVEIVSFTEKLPGIELSCRNGYLYQQNIVGPLVLNCVASEHIGVSNVMLSNCRVLFLLYLGQWSVQRAPLDPGIVNSAEIAIQCVQNVTIIKKKHPTNQDS